MLTISNGKLVSKIYKGSPWPLGTSITKRGVNFSVACPKANYLELIIFKSEDDSLPKEVISLDETHKSGDYWHVEVEGLTIGCHYCYRIPTQKEVFKETRFSNKILLDPCSREISGWNVYDRNKAICSNENVGNCLKGVVSERKKFDFAAHPRPKHPWNKTIIYELHVGGFTNNIESGVPSSIKGTFLGLIEKIPYIKDLGITAIELLPVFAFDDSDSPAGLNNYWGYSPISWFAPHKGFIDTNCSLNAREQFRKLVEICHDNNIEIILDVVYNHTTEGGDRGPVISWKGFGDSTYYHKGEKGEYLDVTGCGNTIAANKPLTTQLILESMRCWANELGVDGFRFDLGISLSRGEYLHPLENPPLFEAIESDPFLSDLKLISEPWDCGGLYKISDFPAKRVMTWNGHFRDDIRKFWKGDKNTTWPLKDRLMGSPAIYKDKSKSSSKSINFITSHDGFTLKDLVSYNHKHNLSNGECNRDGENHNNSWNYGIEGPTTNKEIIAIRNRQQRNLFATLIFSPGIPMILMGDEVGRSQGGNNNSWCQNNPLGWMVWNQADEDEELKEFVKKTIYLRMQFSKIFNPLINLTSEKPASEKTEEIWLQWHGVKLSSPDWGSWSNTIGYSINESDSGSIIWIGLNAYNQKMTFQLPRPITPWVKVIDTGSRNDILQKDKHLSNQDQLELESKSFVLLVSERHSRKLRK
ncbi:MULTISPECIES: glycogen debranching protein [Prochlorococcus]|uniref:glycogen debranching protein n=1 Tax=Prochlorococcus TaxID=1218 RepID=UPI000533B9DD|nr:MULTISPECIES: isoamylase [Prochlorococcus]KGG11954.1 Glycogen debranching enzyme [Prochlorococcus sp. MIT 0601]